MNTGMEDERMHRAKRKLSGLQKSPVKIQKQPRGEKKGIIISDKEIICLIYRVPTKQ